jgi:hypothetical protein
MMMVASPLGSGKKSNMPTPYDASFHKGLDKNSQRNLALDPHLQQQEEWLTPPLPTPRVGSTQALIKQREVLQQDVFQKQNAQDTNFRRSSLELPQKSPSVMEQLQQVAHTTRQFLSQLDRLNQSDLARRQAQGTELQMMEGRHQVHHQNATVYMRIKEPSFVSKSKREEDIARRMARQQRMGLLKGQDAHSTKQDNLATLLEEDTANF